MGFGSQVGCGFGAFSNGVGLFAREDGHASLIPLPRKNTGEDIIRKPEEKSLTVPFPNLRTVRNKLALLGSDYIYGSLNGQRRVLYVCTGSSLSTETGFQPLRHPTG